MLSALIPLILAAGFSGAKPLNCDQYTLYEKAPCEAIEIQATQSHAKTFGQPTPSVNKVSLPAHGSAKAKGSYFVCMGGYATRRLPNGWQQLRNSQHQYIRCRDE